MLSGDPEIVDESDKSNPVVNATLHAGDSFGELALINNEPRARTIRCPNQCSFLTIAKHDYSEILSDVQRLELEERIDFLASIPAFHSWTRAALKPLGQGMGHRVVQRNKVIIRQGDESECMFFIRHGDCKIVKKVNFGATTEPKLLEVGVLGPREFFGERGVILNQPRAASVLSISPVELLVLQKTDYIRKVAGSKTHQLMIEAIDRYPSEEKLKAAYHKQIKWTSFKEGLVRDIKNNKNSRKQKW